MKKILKIAEVQNVISEMLHTMDRICAEYNLRYYLVCGSVLGAVRHGGPIPWDYDVDITVPLPEMQQFCEVMVRELEKTPYRILVPGNDDDVNSITTFPRIALRNVNPRKLHIDVFPQIGITSDSEQQKIHTEQLTKLKTLYRDKRVSKTQNGGFFKVLAKKTYLKLKTFGRQEEELLSSFFDLCEKYPYASSEYVTNPCGHYGIKNIVPKSYFGVPKRIPYLDMMLPVPEQTEIYLEHYYGDYQKTPPKSEIEKLMQYTVEIDEEI